MEVSHCAFDFADDSVLLGELNRTAADSSMPFTEILHESLHLLWTFRNHTSFVLTSLFKGVERRSKGPSR